MEEAFRERARQRYAGRCGDCGVSEENTGAALTIDHHHPRMRGGGDQDDNIVYCCPKCNEHKGSYWHETDPPHTYLLRPLHDDLNAHLRERDDGQLLALTADGAFFIQRLRLNRPQLVAYRLHQRAEEHLREEVDALRQRVQELQERVVELNATLELTEEEIDQENG